MVASSGFWLYQSTGWSLFALLQLLMVASDEPLSLNTALPALLLFVLAISGSLLLRRVYQRWRSGVHSQAATLLLIVVAALLCALAADLLHYWLLWPLAQVPLLWQGAAFNWFDAQPPGAKLPALSMLYLLWSMLYLTLSRQLDLRQSLQARQQLESHMTEAQLSSLLAQLSPHFMFNCINNIRALILEDSQSARLMLGHFADLLRYQIQPQTEALVPLRTELAVLEDYLALLQIQFEHRLAWQADVAPEFLARPVPRLALQLLVENAVKHGISQRRDGGVVRLQVKPLDAEHWLLEVTNPGVLPPADVTHPSAATDNTGTGLKNLRHRLQLIYRNSASLQLLQDGPLVRAQLILPQQSASSLQPPSQESS
jgi:two-component system LytT family sensor kinase